MDQPRLFPREDRPAGSRAETHDTPADAASEVYRYAAARVLQIDGPRVSREMSYLRALARRVVEQGGPPSLLSATEDSAIVSQALRRPGSATQKTALSWLTTLRHFLLDAVGHAETFRRIDAINAQLIPRPSLGWYQVPRVPGGRKSGGPRDRRVLSMIDLLRIVEAARSGKRGELAVRDQAFVAICCSSGLYKKDVVALRWEDVEWEEEPEGRIFPIWAWCRRRDIDLRLPIYTIARGPITTLYQLASNGNDRTPSGPVFRSVRPPHKEIGEREMHSVIGEAQRKAGFDHLRMGEIRAALAHHLNTSHGVTELELTGVLGYGEHKHVRSLLKAHKAMDLNERVDRFSRE